jgi:hypothetical protein
VLRDSFPDLDLSLELPSNDSDEDELKDTEVTLPDELDLEDPLPGMFQLTPICLFLIILWLAPPSVKAGRGPRAGKHACKDEGDDFVEPLPKRGRKAHPTPPSSVKSRVSVDDSVSDLQWGPFCLTNVRSLLRCSAPHLCLGPVGWCLQPVQVTISPRLLPHR